MTIEWAHEPAHGETEMPSTMLLDDPLILRPPARARADASPASLTLGGALTVATAGAFRKLLREAALAADARVLLDLTQVTALDASGIAALLDARRLFGEGGLTVRLNAAVRHALAVSHALPTFQPMEAPEP
jgi:anti-anti-sigma factor